MFDCHEFVNISVNLNVFHTILRLNAPNRREHIKIIDEHRSYLQSYRNIIRLDKSK